MAAELCRAVNDLRVDPANIAVSPAIDHVHPAAGAMLKYQYGRAGEIEFHHRLADREPLQRCRGFRDDDRIEGRDLVLAVRGWRLDDVARRVEFGDRFRRRVRLAGRAILEAALVAAQPLLSICNSD